MYPEVLTEISGLFRRRFLSRRSSGIVVGRGGLAPERPGGTTVVSFSPMSASVVGS